MLRTRTLGALALSAIALLAIGTLALSNGVSAVTRTVLGSGTPPETGRDELALTRVRIPAGESLAAHTHPGLEIATIESGALVYTVIRGRASVRRASGRVITLRSGRTTVLRVGDTITEPRGMVHKARNPGRRVVRIVIGSLFPKGAPVSSPA